MAATTLNTQYTQLTTFPPGWNNLQQIDAALENAHLELSSGKKMMVIQGEAFPFQGIINRIYSLRPCLPDDPPRNKPYLSIAKKLKTIAQEAPTQPNSLCKRFS